jgi:DNA-binding transcriptional LysR family regulator
MNLNHLALFHAVTKEGSVSRAAERLLISQPAISKQLRQLEKSLSVRLLERHRRGMRPTTEGELLESYARRIFALVEETERVMDELHSLQRGQVRIGASTTAAVYLLPDWFVRFRKAYPGIQLHSEIASSEILASRLMEGSLDMVVTEGEVSNELLDAKIVRQDRLVTIVPPDHPLRRKRKVSAAMLCQEPFIVRETRSETRSLVERKFADRGLVIKPVMSLGSTEAIKRAVAARMGVAVVSEMSAELEVRAKKLAIVPLSDLTIRRPVYLVIRRQSHISQCAKVFCQMMDKE